MQTLEVHTAWHGYHASTMGSSCGGKISLDLSSLLSKLVTRMVIDSWLSLSMRPGFNTPKFQTQLKLSTTMYIYVLLSYYSLVSPCTSMCYSMLLIFSSKSSWS